ncbi:MAG TPA: DUF4129 domain-containing protein [Streptosporangiaceae bacterium]
MQDRAASRTVLAVLLLVLAVAGIGAAGPRVTLHGPSRPAALAVAAGLEVVLAGLLLALRLGKPAGSGPAIRLRAMVSAVLVTGLIAVPAGVVIAILHPARHSPRRQRPPAVRIGPGHHIIKAGHTGNPAFVSLRPLLFAVLLAALLVALIVAWRRGHRLRLSSRVADPLAGDEESATPAELARAVGSGRRALRDLDDARAAIIGCYVAMEDSLARAGARRGDAETPDELLGRARAAGLIAAGPAARLTELFYEARFSTHPMPPATRAEASAALASLAAGLPQPAASEAP